MHAKVSLRIVLVIIVMLVFISTGILKLMSSPQEVAAFLAWGYPLWLMYLTGVLNIVFAVGLCIRKISRLSVIALMALLATAIISNIFTEQSLFASLPAFLLFCSLIYILYFDKHQTRERN